MAETIEENLNNSVQGFQDKKSSEGCMKVNYRWKNEEIQKSNREESQDEDLNENWKIS